MYFWKNDFNGLMIAMKKSRMPEKQTYVAPDMSVRPLSMELSFLASNAGATMDGMDPYELFDEDF